MIQYQNIFRIAVLCAVSFSSAIGQNRSRLTPEAQLESRRHYIDAARRYSAASGVPDNILKAGINFYRAGRNEQALVFLQKADSLGLLKSAEDRFAYFQCLKNAKKYREADKFISAAASESPDTLLLMNANRLSYYEKVMSYSGSQLNEVALNTEFSEFGPAVFNGVLYFNSTRPSVSNKQVHRLNMQPYYNLYGMSEANTSETAFQPVGSFGVAEQQVTVNGQSVGVLPAGINQKYHDGPVFVTPSGKHMFFTSNWEGKKRHHNNKRIRLNIYHSVRENGIWGLPQSLPFNGKDWSAQHAVFDEETSVLYFSSNMPGGRGGFDIWTAYLQDGKWSEAQNLGKNVNTPGNEVFPMLTRDGGLLFSSNGWPGLGGLDIFLSDDPSRPSINLLAGVNSEADDFQMLFTKSEIGYVVSNRAGGKGDDDIWAFKVNLNDIRMANSAPLPANIALRYNGFHKPVAASIELKEKQQTVLLDVAEGDGRTRVLGQAGSVITARADGYIPAVTVLEKDKLIDGNMLMTLEPANGTSGEAVDDAGQSVIIDFENRSFEGLQGALNGGTAVIAKRNDADENATLMNGQQLQTADKRYGNGTYGASVRAADANSSQSISVLSDGSGKPGYTLEVTPNGSDREGWSLSSGGNVLVSGKDVPAKVGTWYDLKLLVRPDSVIALINGKKVGGVKNPDPAKADGPIVVSSKGTGQFDDIFFRPLGRMPRVKPGDLVLLPAEKRATDIASAVKAGEPLATTAPLPGWAGNEQVLAAGLEQIRREQAAYQGAVVKATGAGVTPLSGNTGADEVAAFTFEGREHLSAGASESGAVKPSLFGNGPYRLSYQTPDGKRALASGGFGEGNAGQKGSLPAGPDGKSYSGPVTVSSAGNWMVFGDGKGNLYYSQRNGNAWNTPVPFSYNSTDANGSAGTVKADNREGYFDEATSTLYFSSNRPDGFGGYDIWMSSWNGTAWSKPVNAGPMVNTGRDEVTPSVFGGMLIFSSNGWPGLGGQDVYVWKPGMIGPANLLRSVNTASDDVSAWIAPDGQGFLSSNRAGGKGKFDVYRFKADPVKMMSLHAGLGAGAAKTDVDQAITVGSSSMPWIIPYATVLGELEGLSDNGEFLDIEIADPAGSPVAKSYRIVDGMLVTAKDVDRHNNELRKVTVRGKDSRGNVITRVLEIWPAESGKSSEGKEAEAKGGKVVQVRMLDNNKFVVYFDFDRISIRKDATEVLAKVAYVLLEEFQAAQVLLKGHTDTRGSSAYNELLSKNRVIKVKEWLVARGVDPRRIRTDYYGEVELAKKCLDNLGREINPDKCLSKEEHQLNRRVEIEILNASDND